ncbi:MAG: winged helix-turn-helix transcriptional regulator [Thermoplasmata archaeon]|nr:winged helix-turn-helix transcriptional regulator [Thermoplasmata archaeon]
MDDTDRKLLLLISAEPRMHLRELAERLGISRQAAHHRIRVLTEIGVIQGMTAGISIYYLDAVPLVIFGRSQTASIAATLDRLGKSEFTRIAVVAGGNYLYVIGELRDTSELDGYAEFVKRAAEMPEPTVGLYSLDSELSPKYLDGGKRKRSYKELSPLDLRIISSLKEDARMSVADIADMVGVSAKTVRRHLENMISEGSLDLNVPWDPPSGEDVYTLVHVNLRGGADKAEVGKRLLSKYPIQVAFIRTFINLPGFLLCALCSDKMTETRRVLREIGEDEDVQAIMFNLNYFERKYSTWRDKLPEGRTPPSKKAGTRNLRSRLRTQ